MFGNDFIDYCAVHYGDLVKISNSQFDELIMNHLDNNTKVFVEFYQQLQKELGKPISVGVFLNMGIDFTRLCLLVFLIFVKEGNTVISFTPDMRSIIYQP
jgi:large-conductance mechanosensitive channel